MTRRVRSPILVLATLVLALTPGTAGAQYLDPGAASILVQVVLALVVGAIAGIKFHWTRIAALFSRRSKDTSPP